MTAGPALIPARSVAPEAHSGKNGRTNPLSAINSPVRFKSSTQKFVASCRMACFAGYRAHGDGEQRCGRRSNWRLAKNFDTIFMAKALSTFVTLGSIQLALRRLARA
jgi:hypothetical protein